MATVGVAAATLSLGIAHADSGKSSDCDKPGTRAKEFPEVGWQFFAAHKVVANGADCRSLLPVKFFRWTQTPNITTPATLPSGALEEVEVKTQPFLVRESATQVVYKFEVEQSIIKVGASTFTFTLTYDYDKGMRICAVDSDACSKWHW